MLDGALYVAEEGAPRDHLLAPGGGPSDDRRQRRARHAALGSHRYPDDRAAGEGRLRHARRGQGDRVHRRGARARRGRGPPPPSHRALPPPDVLGVAPGPGPRGGRAPRVRGCRRYATPSANRIRRCRAARGSSHELFLAPHITRENDSRPLHRVVFVGAAECCGIGRTWSCFQILRHIAGLGLGTWLALTLASRTGLSPAVVVVLLSSGIFTFLVLAMATKIATGRESLVYYHHEVAILSVSAGTLLTAASGLPVSVQVSTSPRLGSASFARRPLWSAAATELPGHSEAHAREVIPAAYVGARLFPVQALEALVVGTIVSSLCDRRPPRRRSRNRRLVVRRVLFSSRASG